MSDQFGVIWSPEFPWSSVHSTEISECIVSTYMCFLPFWAGTKSSLWLSEERRMTFLNTWNKIGTFWKEIILIAIQLLKYFSFCMIFVIKLCVSSIMHQIIKWSDRANYCNFKVPLLGKSFCYDYHYLRILGISLDDKVLIIIILYLTVCTLYW